MFKKTTKSIKLEKLNFLSFNNLAIYLLLSSLSYTSSCIASTTEKDLAKLSGEITQGSLVVGKTASNNKVYLNEQPLKVSTQGYFTFGFGRDDIDDQELKIVTPTGVEQHKLLTPSLRTYKTQKVNGIAQKIMNPDPKSVERAQQDNIQIAQVRKIDSNLTAFSQGFVAPIKGTITGVYGSQRVYNGVPKRPHFGLDYAGKIGDPVKAPADGVITLNVPDMFYSGGTLIIDHGHGVTSTFLHLSNTYVKVGDSVKQGDVIAAVGASGRATGPHLDWRINWFDVRLDPQLALDIKPLN